MNSAIPCRLLQHIATVDGWFAGRSTITLPFAPSPGMVLSGFARPHDEAKIDSVRWDVAYGYFAVRLSPNILGYMSAEAVRDAYGPGWTWGPSAESIEVEGVQIPVTPR